MQLLGIECANSCIQTVCSELGLVPSISFKKHRHFKFGGVGEILFCYKDLLNMRAFNIQRKNRSGGFSPKGHCGMWVFTFSAM